MSRGSRNRDDDYDDRNEDDDFDDRGSGREPHRATLVLVFGILSLVICAPLGIAAWIMGKNDLAAMRSGRMDSSGKDMTNIGYILGIVGTIVFCLQLVFAIIYFVFIVAVIGAAGAGAGK